MWRGSVLWFLPPPVVRDLSAANFCLEHNDIWTGPLDTVHPCTYLLPFTSWAATSDFCIWIRFAKQKSPLESFSYATRQQVSGRCLYCTFIQYYAIRAPAPWLLASVSSTKTPQMSASEIAEQPLNLHCESTEHRRHLLLRLIVIHSLNTHTYEPFAFKTFRCHRVNRSGLSRSLSAFHRCIIV